MSRTIYPFLAGQGGVAVGKSRLEGDPARFRTLPGRAAEEAVDGGLELAVPPAGVDCHQQHGAHVPTRYPSVQVELLLP
jgi:hypothetical protein